MPGELLNQLRELDRLPSIPGVALEIIELLQSDDVPISRLADGLSRDPAIVTKVLKTANSSMFGARREVTSVQHAITLLGLRTVNLLALSFSLVAGPRGRHGAFDYRRFWQHCAATTTTSRYLASRVAPELCDEAFLAGLLCKLGTLVLAEGLPERYAPLLAAAARSGQRVHEIEERELHTNHAVLAGKLLDDWGLPPLVCRAVGGHLAPSSLEPGSQERQLAQILHVASACAELCFGSELEAATGAIMELAASYFNMTPEDCTELIGHIEQALPQVAALLDVELEDPRAMSDVFMRASRLVVKETLALNQQVQQATAEARRFEKRATTDALTGLGNRGFFEETLDAALDEAHRDGRPFGLLILDLDHFKSVNDGHGHAVGDELLRRVGGSLANALQPYEQGFRYGGEELAVLLPGTGADDLRARAESFRAAIAAIEIATPQGPLRRTVSIGGCWLERVPDPSVAALLIDAADRELYRAKAAGRNRVHLTRRLSG